MAMDKLPNAVRTYCKSQVLNEAGAPVSVVARFLSHLAARSCSPNTVVAYGYDRPTFGGFSIRLSLAGTV